MDIHPCPHCWACSADLRLNIHSACANLAANSREIAPNLHCVADHTEHYCSSTARTASGASISIGGGNHGRIALVFAALHTLASACHALVFLSLS